MILLQGGHIIDNFNSPNSVHCPDISQVPNVTSLKIVRMLLVTMMTILIIMITGSIGDPWLSLPGLKWPPAFLQPLPRSPCQANIFPYIFDIYSKYTWNDPPYFCNCCHSHPAGHINISQALEYDHDLISPLWAFIEWKIGLLHFFLSFLFSRLLVARLQTWYWSSNCLERNISIYCCRYG